MNGDYFEIVGEKGRSRKKTRLVAFGEPGIASKWEAMMCITRKVESNGRGVDESNIDKTSPLIKKFTELCPPDEYERVFNPGAGCGLETKLLEDAGYEVVGTTFGEDNARAAMERHGIELAPIDMQDTPFGDGEFDASFSSQAFEHAFSPWMAVLELRRITRDGGRVFIDVPDANDEGMLRTIWHTNVLNGKQIRAFFWKAGFEEVNTGNDWWFCFEKLPDDGFETWGYVKWIMDGEG